VKEASGITPPKKYFFYQHLLESSVGNMKFSVAPSFNKAIRLPLPFIIAVRIAFFKASSPAELGNSDAI
jgi:hypothetical protein